MTAETNGMSSKQWIGAFGVLAISWAVGQAQAPAALKVESLNSPAGANSSVPQMTVQGDRVVLSWVEREGTKSALKFAERTATGWSTPMVVVSSDHLMVNSADVPSVRAMPDGAFAAHWMEESGPDPEAYDLRVAWSSDGKTWTAPVAPNRDKTMTQHGFATLFPIADGGTGVIWLDGRTTHGEEGDMQLRAAMFDKAHKSLSDSLIDSRVCECCPTSVALTADGPIAAYRNRSAADIRDIYVTRLDAGKWSMPLLVHRDNFKIEACPINGPAVAASGKDVAVAWFTAPNEKQQSFVAFSHDGGRTFGKATKVEDAGTLGRMQVALAPDGAVIVGWVEFANEKSTFTVRR
ncbi:MAG TPA: sialidase family protein, partial [Vicinamibacterales bacterium]|nr:sialidase family protein [Vicinamibacterales bacterium]